MDTVANNLQWGILYMTLNPGVQMKAQQEIDSVIRDRQPSWEDRLNMPYIQACIAETQRLACIAPALIPRKTMESVQLAGYTIPARTVLMPLVWSLDRDATIWRNAETFDPDRHLNADGDFDRKEQLIPFGIGRQTFYCWDIILSCVHVFKFVRQTGI